MSTTHPIQRFIELREAVLKGWGEQRKKSDQALRSPLVIAQAHYLLMVLGSMIVGVLTIVPRLAERLQPWVLPVMPAWGIFPVTLLIWLFLLALPSGLIYGLKRTWLLVIYTLFGLPLLLAWSDALARSDISQLLQTLIVFVLFSFTLLLQIVSLILLFGSSIHGPLSLLFTSVRAGRRGGVFPSYEMMIWELNLHLEPFLQDLSDADVGQITQLVQHKQTGINARLQILALVSGVLALLSLAALPVAENVMVGLVDLAIVLFLGADGIRILVIALVVSVLIGVVLFICMALLYARQTYHELQLLEIISLVCALRQAAPAPAAPRAHAATPLVLNVAPATTQPRPLLLVGLLLGLALLRRILTRR